MGGTIRQKKVSSLLLREISQIIQQNGGSYYGLKPFVTVSDVSVSPDLMVAKIFVSIYNVDDKEAVLDQLGNSSHDIRHKLGNILRHHLRRVPHLNFQLDDSLDTVYRLEKLFDDIKQTAPETPTDDNDTEE